MQLGFVSAILPELPLADALAFARDEGFSCVEAMYWPFGRTLEGRRRAIKAAGNVLRPFFAGGAA